LTEKSASQSANIQAEILKALLDSKGARMGPAELKKTTGFNRGTIGRAIDGLRESGISIVGSKEYAVESLPDSIPAAMLLCGLRSRFMGREVYSYETIGSTNETARRMAESGTPEGTIVLSERQTKGRGRLGRSWHSPAGKGLYFSLVLRPRIPIGKVPALSLVAALAVCRVGNQLPGLDVKMKWPNDCLIKGRKVAGILVEVSAELDRVAYSILGIGINVNHRKKDFPSSLRSRATSLAIETKRPVDRLKFLQDFLFEFEKSYNNFTTYGLRFIGRELVERSSVINRRITVRVGRKKITGLVVGLDENGALRLQAREGVRVISAGEVTLR
jgi:BirA family biotin operon repressor/biotin-[acetyl-CoA-carboxylase] ligase